MADKDFDRGKIHKLGSIGRELLVTGLKLDQYDLESALWKSGSNVRFSNSGVEKVQGYSAIFATTPTAPIRGMTAVVDSGIQKLYYGDQAALYESVAAGAPTTVGSGYTGNLNGSVTSQASYWSMVGFGTWILATNGKDAPQIFKTTSFTTLNLDSQFTTAEVFMVSGPHVIAMNLDTNQKTVAWSDEDDPETWIPDTANAAGSLILRELEGGIIAAASLGDKIAIYGKDQMFILSYVGAPFYFGYKPALDSIGAVSKAVVVSHGRLNYGLGRHGFWVTDGVQINYIDDPDIKNWVQDNVNWAQVSKACGYHDEENTQIVWCVPTTTGEPDTTIAYDYERKVWSMGNIDFTSAIPREVFNNPLIADSSGDVWYTNFGQDANGAALSASIQSVAIDLNEPDLIKEITAIRIGYIGSGLRFRVGNSETVDGTVEWTSYIEVPAGFEFQPMRLSGRYLWLELDSQDIGDEWSVQRIDFHGRIGGTR